MSQNKPIFYIGGGKGGVGKSLVASSLIDYLLSSKKKVFLIETDTSNPDVYKAYHVHVLCDTINLTSKDGWLELVTTCDMHKDHHIVINTGACNADYEQKYMHSILIASLPLLERQLTPLWVINRQRDSVELLKAFSEIITEIPIHVIMNGYFGNDEKFGLFNESNLKKTLEKNGSKSVLFPDLADRVTDALYTNRITIGDAINMKDMPIGNKVELMRWRTEVHQCFSSILEHE